MIDREPDPLAADPTGGVAGRHAAAAARRRRFAVFVAGAAVVWLLVMLIAGDSGVLALFRARTKLAELEQRVLELEQANERLRLEIRALEEDDEAVLRIAREQLMMARPDEEVILVGDPKQAAVPAGDAPAGR